MAENKTENREQNRHKPDSVPISTGLNAKLRTGSYLLVATAFLFLIQGVGMIYRALISNRYEMGVSHLGDFTAPELAETYPAVQSYIDHLAVNLGGLMIASGIAMGALVWYGVRRGHRWALGASVAIPTLYALFGLSIHQTVHFHFDQIVHLGPAGIGIPLLLVGTLLAYVGLQSVDEN